MRYTQEYLDTRSVYVPETGCKLWIKSLDLHGYGRIRDNKEGRGC